MHQESLTKDTQNILRAIGSSGVASHFYLAGGTALGLYFGHRLSVDLDQSLFNVKSDQLSFFLEPVVYGKHRSFLTTAG